MSKTIKKNQRADVKTKSGSNYSYKYVDIAQIHEYLEENNMSYYQYIDRIEGDDYIMTVRIIDGEEKEPIRGSRVVDATLFGNDNPAQKQGSALTYARRYSLLMAFGLATEDNDANDLNKEVEPTEDDAKNWKFQFGKYKDKTMLDILKSDAQYVKWFIQNKATPYDKQCYEINTGEKLPTDEELKERMELLMQFESLTVETNTQREEIYEYYGVENNTQMTTEQLKEVVDHMKKKVQE